jgi:hypothetical protein
MNDSATDPAERRRIRDRARTAANSAKVFAHYGRVCACPGCGATEQLEIDHINGGGTEHRRTARTGNGSSFHAWLIRQGFPEGFQTHCHPCNMSKGEGPACRIDHNAPPGWSRCLGPCGQTLSPAAFYHRSNGQLIQPCRDCQSISRQRPEMTETCPECGKPFTPHGLLTHRSMIHGIRGSSYRW